jgi:hypothetical protein
MPISKTPLTYNAGQYTYRNGPVGRIERERKPFIRETVRVARYNGIVLRRKLRLASYVSAPRLVKHTNFQNNPHN